MAKSVISYVLTISEYIVLQHIPRHVTPHNLMSNGGRRFSAGWNQFAKDNRLRKFQNLFFTMVENIEEITFHINGIRSNYVLVTMTFSKMTAVGIFMMTLARLIFSR